MGKESNCSLLESSYCLLQPGVGGGGMPGAGEIHSPRAGAGTGGSPVLLVVPTGQSSHLPGPRQCG